MRGAHWPTSSLRTPGAAEPHRRPASALSLGHFLNSHLSEPATSRRH